MKLSDRDALLLCVDALPVADVWHEINQEEMIEIHQQASRELARIEGELLEYKKLSDVIMCAYCGHESPKGDKMAVVEHTMNCEKRPEVHLLKRAFEVEDGLYQRIIHLTEHTYSPGSCAICKEIAETLSVYREA